MKHHQYKEICLGIKNDLDYEEFLILSSNRQYSTSYTESIWRHYSEKPLEFVLYHDLGKDIFEFIKWKLQFQQQI